MESEQPREDVKMKEESVKTESTPESSTPKTESTVTDEALETKIKEIVPTLDLEKTSGKAVRGLLEKEFGISLKERRKFIDKIILRVIDEQNNRPDKSEPTNSQAEKTEKKNKKKSTSTKKEKKSTSKKKESKKNSIESDQALAEELAAEGSRPRRQAAAKSYARAERNRKLAEKPKKKIN